jgi:hypothetical protein
VDRPDPVGLLEEQAGTFGLSPDEVVPALHDLFRAYYARLCGWTQARAHARSGDPVATAEHLGGDHAFDQSITDFCERYADQNEQDYKEFVKAVRSGRLEAVEGV